MSTIDVLSEGHYLDDNNTLIAMHFIDTRDQNSRTPIASLVKRCKREHAIEDYGIVRICKPSYYREHGNPSLRDQGEGRASHIVSETSTITDDPEELAWSQSRSDALNRGMLLANQSLGEKASSVQVRSCTKSVQQRKTTTTRDTINFGRNGWIFCTSVAPVNEEEYEAWKRTMGEDYDHTSHFYSPRQLARALAEMAADQLGPQSGEAKLESRFGGVSAEPAVLQRQAVFHGPVIYTDDVYELLGSAPTNLDFILLSVFAKDTYYAPEREYRFLVWTEDEPSSDCVDLLASTCLLASMEEPTQKSSPQTVPTVSIRSETSDQGDRSVEPDAIEGEVKEASSFPNLSDLISNPATPSTPHDYTTEEPPDDLDEKLRTYSATAALRSRFWWVTGSRRIEVASAAWHAEPCIRRLCARFDDPVARISIADTNDIIIEIKFPEGSSAAAALVVSPQGTALLKIERPRGATVSHNYERPQFSESELQKLADLGLPVRS